MIYSIIEQVLIYLPLILGAYLTLSLLKVPDFSIESAFLCGAVAALLAKDLPLPFILLSAFVGGSVVGIIVSFFNQYLGVPFLLAAIVTNGLFHGITQYLLGTSVASFQMDSPVPEFVLSSIVGFVLVGCVGVGLRSQLGYSLSIYGNNSHFFSNHHMSGQYVMIFGVVMGHGLAGISGFLFAQSNGFVDITMNFGVILLCLTALIVGKLCIQGNRPVIAVPLIGLSAYFIIQQVLLSIGLNLKYFNAFQALFILGTLVLGKRKQKTFNLDHLGV